MTGGAAPGLQAIIQALATGGQPQGNLSNVQNLFGGGLSPFPADPRAQFPVSPLAWVQAFGLPQR